MNLDVTVRDDRTAVLRPAGRLNLVTSPQLRNAVDDAVAAGNVLVVVDLSGVEFIDSSGLGALVAGLKSTRAAGGDLRLAAGGAQVVSVLRLTNLDRVLKVHGSVEAAVGA